MVLAACGSGSSGDTGAAPEGSPPGAESGGLTDATMGGSEGGPVPHDGSQATDGGAATPDAVSRDGSRPDAVGPDAAAQDGGSQAGEGGDAAGTTMAVYVTFYGWADNSPPGNGIAYPKSGGNQTIHNAAGGVGTFADPITFATDRAEFAEGTVLYVPYIQKYVAMEDSCGQCTTDWASHMWHIDVWMNSNGTEMTSALLNCESAWTRSQTDVELNPPPTRTVTTAPLFDPSTNTCRTTP